jgi:hypothetical protein
MGGDDRIDSLFSLFRLIALHGAIQARAAFKPIGS